MGTRSTVHFYNASKETGKQKHIVSVYHQFDGYLSGVGQDLLDFIRKGERVNGMGRNSNLFEVFNGAYCMAAQYIAKHKDRAGGLYISSEEDRQGYDYMVYWDFNTFDITISFGGNDYSLDGFQELINEEQ